MLSPLFVIAIVAGLYMAWAIGANDVANAMGTSVGSGALTLKRAIIVAAVFEFTGAVVAGSSVSKTIRKGIIDASSFTDQPDLLVYGMIASLLAAAVWLNIASRQGWPVSTTHSIVGAIVGFAAVGVGVESVNWGKVVEIVGSWVTSPLLSGVIAFIFFTVLQRLILHQKDPLRRTRAAVPYMVFGTTLIISLVTLWKGLKHLDLHLSGAQTTGLAIGLSFLSALLARVLVNRLPDKEDASVEFQFTALEKVFGVLQIYTACAVAFAHGSNDVANAIGPLAAVISTLQTGEVTAESNIPVWMLLLGGVGIVVGLSTYGYKVMATVGEKITHLTPSRGYVAEFAAAATIVVASRFGLPISTTHTLIGAVLGVSLARGVAATNFAILGQIVMSWVITLPAGALLSIVFFYLLKAIFGG